VIIEPEKENIQPNPNNLRIRVMVNGEEIAKSDESVEEIHQQSTKLLPTNPTLRIQATFKARKTQPSPYACVHILLKPSIPLKLSIPLTLKRALPNA
jgi:hypothetical protein